ncbi:hypothetical protein [Lapillicoccus sp.]|uniref:DUF6918 family protein n=1 Tax=Lapillicoccus sp. TaxID=1909287 RepID=UPI0025DF0D62|nr:hypothetical protein [Lapillicoccus sp.]
MPTLSETLLAPDRRPSTVDALVGVVDAEVKSKSGIGGAAIKTAYAAAKKVDSRLVSRATNRMLPDFLTALEPYWQEGTADFGAHLTSQQDAVTESLLAVTDRRADNPSHAAVAKVYGMVRPKAKTHVTAALPRLGSTLQSLAGTVVTQPGSAETQPGTV